MGGTIDKDYNDAPNKENAHVAMNFNILTPAYERVLDLINPSFSCRSLEIAKKDSLELDDADRKKLLEACMSATEDRIVITHGTDTMLETAEVLDQIKDKTIVITGAMRPERFNASDAHFNLGTAVGGAYSLEPGIYIAMSGIISLWNNVSKNYSGGNFVES